MFVSRFRVRTHSIFLTVAMLAALLYAPASAIAADPVAGADFTLTILHNNDGESQLINAGSGLEDFGGIARFKTLVDGLRADAIANGNGVLMLSSGDNFLAGPEFNAGIENGVPFFDTIALEAIGYDAISLGNHDFDFGPDVLANFLTGYVDAPQYLNSNLDFTGEPGLQAFVDSGVIAPSTVVTTAGQDIGIVGAITPSLRSISSPRNVVIDFDVAGAIQAQVDALVASGVNKIVLISHLQDITEDLALAAELTGVDVMIAGGGDELLANPGDPLVPGEEETVFGAYPLTATGADGAEIPVVTTPGEYKYVGQLSVGFDADGNVTGIGTDSGPKVVAGTVAADAALQASVVDPVVAAIATLDATVIGTSEVALDGTRDSVRNVESNEGNLLADALWWQATELASAFGVNPPDVALQNGGGIRNNTVIEAGDITVLDTFDVAPFANFVSVVEDIPRDQFKTILENAVSDLPGGGRFAQIAGFSFVYDPVGTPMMIDGETGAVTQVGSRIVGVALDDGTVIVEAGAVVAGDPITIATIDFLARGGDQYPYDGAPFTTIGVTYQQALANYITDGLTGVISAADYPEGGEGRSTALDLAPIEGPFTPIYEIQGSGDASPLDGQAVEVAGYVTGVFPDLGGFYLQDGAGDGDATTSDGIFVATTTGVAAGDHAEVRGVAAETFDETQIVDVTAIEVEDTGGAIAATELSLPLTEGTSLEAYEGMLITFPDYLFVSDTFNLHRFGEAVLSEGGVLVNPTNIAAPGDPAIALAAANSARQIIIDDGSGDQFPDTVPYFGADGTLRRGDAAKGITANLSFSFGAYKLQPAAEVSFESMNPRPVGPDDVGGNLKVASFNVLNFFSTIDDGENGARGADSDAEKAAQLDKLVAAISGLGADIIGIQEIENNGPVAIGELVDALNAVDGAGTWAAAADPEYPGGLEATNAIKVGIIFQTASVTPVGGTEVSEDPVFGADRPAIAHTFTAFGDTFTVINNHFKSKSSTDAEGLDLDQGDGQGAYNTRRTAQAAALLDFAAELAESSGDPDVLVIGDFNSYPLEDPIVALEAGGLTNLVKDNLTEEDTYSLIFFGAQGLLDYAFASDSLAGKVTGADLWHINADEPRVLQYNDDVIDPAERSSDFNQPLAQPDEFSSSDHDPLIVGLQLGEGPVLSATVVASGLNGPRHLNLGPDGTLYVAESGTGGSEPCVPDPEGGESCLGFTGGVTAITDAGQIRIASGIASHAEPPGFAAIGPSDVAVAADGTVRTLVGLGTDPAIREEVLTPAGGGDLGQLLSLAGDGTWTASLDVAAYEAASNPDGGAIDSNPNAIIHTDNGYLIVDAGANALLRFDGTVLSTVAVFPDRLVPAPPFIPEPEIPMQAVPTSVAVGPDGAYYVGQLTGFPFPPGLANVYRIDPGTGAMRVFADGFTNIIDVEFGPDGSLYVLQISSSGILSEEFDGALIRVAPDGTRQVVEDGLFAPGGLAISTTGDIYVSNCGICPGDGEVLLLDAKAPPAPTTSVIDLGYSASNDRSTPAALDGATVAGKIYPFVTPLDPGLGFTTVDFYLDGGGARTEYLAPYDFAGGLLTRATAWETSAVSDGEHTIKVVGNLPDGSTIDTSATFTVDNAPTMTEDFTVAFSDSEFRTDPVMLDGAFVGGGVYPFVYPLFPEGFEAYGRVSFYLDGVAFHTEYQAPYDFVSGGIVKANEVWDTKTQEEGVHTITVKAHRDGATPLVARVTFTVSNDTEPPPPPPPPPPEAVRFATFNASLNRGNAGDLVADLSTPDNAQAKVIAETIQRTRPEVLLLNEFDFDVDGEGARLFQENYLAVSQNGAEPIVYGYAFSAPSNTGIASGLDLDNSGDVGGPNDAFGFGFFEGQFGMQVYSQYPIDFAKVRTFQNFIWADMPGALLVFDPVTFTPWYSPEELAAVRLSSKSHWDVPIMIGDETVNFLVSHPTPPVFDGPEDRNGTRNYDEIRFWKDYVNGADYIYDDDGITGGWAGDYFVIAGDQNSDPFDGDSQPGAAQLLLDDARVNTSVTPSSLGAVEQDGLQGGANLAHLGDPAFDTADFNDNPAPGNLRADYVLPSANLDIVDSGVFWPESTDPLFPLVGTFPFPGSDHRLVWVDLLPGATALPPPVEPPTPMTFTVTVENLTDGQPFTPLGVTVHDPSFDVFSVGEPASIGIQELAENGNPAAVSEFIQANRSLQSGGYLPSGPLVPAADPGNTGFASSETFQVTALPGHVLSIGFMLICTNDGFSGLDSVPLPSEGETLVIEANAYDAGTEINTEDFADMVPPCQGLIGVGSEDEGTGASNPDLAEGGVIAPHAGILGGNDLDPAVHGWTGPVARITIVKGEGQPPPPPPEPVAFLVADFGRGSLVVPGPGDPDALTEVFVDVFEEPEGSLEFCFFVITTVDGPTVAHIHRGAAGGAGDVVVNTGFDASSWTPDEFLPTDLIAEGCVLVDETLGNEILSNPLGFHFNVHSEAFPAAATREQLFNATDLTERPRAFTAAPLVGANEVPDSGDPNANGASFIFAPITDNGEWCYDMFISGVDEITAGHIHSGAAGVAGGVFVSLEIGSVWPVIADPNGQGWLMQGCVPVSAEQQAAIAADPGAFYINVHNAAHPGGAGRAQLAAGFGDENVYLAELAPAAGVGPDAGGFTPVVLFPVQDHLCWGADVSGIGMPTGMVITDATGEVLAFDLARHPFVNNPLPFADYTSLGCQPADSTLVDNILGDPGAFTVEVNTADYQPALSGQIFNPNAGPPAEANIVTSVVKAPIVPDGDVAGADTDFVINLDRSLDPKVDGRSLTAGDTIRITLPEEFINNGLDTGAPGASNCVPGPCNAGVLLQAWPQHPIAPPAAKYSLAMEGTHTFVFTALEDLGPAGPENPGIKQIHLILVGFDNPTAGDYQIVVEAMTGPDGAVETGTGTLTIRPAVVPSINVTSVFNEATPNTIYQETGTGQATPYAYDFLLFDASGGPMTGVSLQNGNLVQGGTTVGTVTITAPEGATGQAVTVAEPSTEIVGPVLGAPTARLTAVFTAGSAPGNYQMTFSLTGGTSVTMSVTATEVEGTPPAPVDVLLTAALNGPNAVPGPGDPDGSGTAEMTIIGTTLSWSISVKLIGDIQAGHVHEGDASVAGPVFINLDLGPVVFVDDGTGTFSGTGSLTVTEEQAQAVAANPAGFYLNLHTPQFPAGAIRGQLVEPN